MKNPFRVFVVVLLSGGLVSAGGYGGSMLNLLSRFVSWFFLMLDNWDTFTSTNHIHQSYIIFLLIVDVVIGIAFLYSSQKGMSAGISICFLAFILNSLLIIGYIIYAIIQTKLSTGQSLLPF